MTRLYLRAALSVTLAAVLVMPAVRTAYAVEERIWLSGEAGLDLFDPEQALRDAPAFGVRGTGFLNNWVGVEGLFRRASTHMDPKTLGDATVSHYGGGLVLTPQRTAWALPYLYGGLGSVKVKRQQLGSDATASAYHAGVGVLFRAGERLGIRLDARDVSYKQKDGPGRATRVNEFSISSGVTAFWMGRPRDSDGDGVPDKRDRCPDTPKGAVVDARGCPLDTDGDGVYDGLDKCSDTPKGAIVDANGCPIDSDGDGVYDGIDKCPDTPKGVLVDATGCPLDSDGDHVFDGLDQCPDTPKGAIVDAKGCPLDADGDGVPDGIDTCPFTPPGVPVNAGGCPVVMSPIERDVTNDWIIRLGDLEFVPDSVKLMPQGLARVDSVGTFLEQWPMLRFEVGVHSDNLGEDARRQPLSHLRARYVLQMIYAKHPSLNVKNYYYTGYGDTQPIASNKTPEGRAKNRRAEFRLLNMDMLTKERARRESYGMTAVPPAPGLKRRMPGETVPEGGAPSGTAPGGTPGNGPHNEGSSTGASPAQAAPAGTSGGTATPTEKIPHAPTRPDSIPHVPSRPDTLPPPPPVK